MSMPASPMPIVVQIGFSGSRRLLDTEMHADVDESAFLAEVAHKLTERMSRLRAELGLQPHHFLCGISQIAAGADVLFAQACRSLGIPQRVFLPENREAYLSATGSRGTPDFSDTDKTTILELLSSTHIIQERVVSDALDRHTRFEDVNLEIVRTCDVVVCLVAPGSGGRPGGTLDVVQRAVARKKSVLLITVNVKSGHPDLIEEWRRHQSPDTAPDGQRPFVPPALPLSFPGPDWQQSTHPGVAPDYRPYLLALKNYSRDRAKKWKHVFGGAAITIIGTHVIATILALLALLSKKLDLLPSLLIAELALLSIGFGVHQFLHVSGASRSWALSRLVAEVTYSSLSIGPLHIGLDHLFRLQLPDGLRPLVESLNVLHLRDTRAGRGKAWTVARLSYIDSRLRGSRGQIGFYGHQADSAARDLKVARGSFVAFSGAAIVVVLVKLAMPHGASEHERATLVAVFGGLTVVLPIIAVAAVSLAAALDREARHHTFREMHAYLAGQVVRLEDAESEREFAHLVLETETRLLGETVNWYSRRSYTGVA